MRAVPLPLVKQTRQRLHRQVGGALEKAFPEVVETQPELVAHHLGEAGETARSVDYWLQAGERTQRRSAHIEAIRHMTRGLDAVARLPDGPDRAGAELRFRLLLSGSYLATQGYAAPAVESEVQRAKVLSAEIDRGGAVRLGRERRCDRPDQGAG
jgi:predicted ATPase